MHQATPSPVSRNPESLIQAYLLVSLACERETDRDWLRKKFAMLHETLKDSWAYQEIIQEGRQQEQRAALQEARQLLLEILQVRFPRLLLQAQRLLPKIEEKAVLHNAIVHISLSDSQDEVSKYLHNLGTNDQDAA